MMIRSPRALALAGALALSCALHVSQAAAGPETSLRELAGGQVKKGVRTIGLGGDGATTGNYALVYKDAGAALVDYGAVRYSDTGSAMTFTAVGVTTPTFWDDAAFYVIALGQTGNDIKVWSLTAKSAKKPPSTGNLSDTSVFTKFAKPITPSLSFGLMGAFEMSQASLLPDAGGPAIRFATSYLPSGGFGLHFHPDDEWQAGVRVTMTSGAT